MRSEVFTVGTSAVDVLQNIPDGNAVAGVLVPRADVCVVDDSTGTYDETAAGAVGPTGDVSSLTFLTVASKMWVVAESAGQEVVLFWSVQ